MKDLAKQKGSMKASLLKFFDKKPGDDSKGPAKAQQTENNVAQGPAKVYEDQGGPSLAGHARQQAANAPALHHAPVLRDVPPVTNKQLARVKEATLQAECLPFSQDSEAQVVWEEPPMTQPAAGLPAAAPAAPQQAAEKTKLQAHKKRLQNAAARCRPAKQPATAAARAFKQTDNPFARKKPEEQQQQQAHDEAGPSKLVGEFDDVIDDLFAEQVAAACAQPIAAAGRRPTAAAGGAAAGPGGFKGTPLVSRPPHSTLKRHGGCSTVKRTPLRPTFGQTAGGLGAPSTLKRGPTGLPSARKGTTKSILHVLNNIDTQLDANAASGSDTREQDVAMPPGKAAGGSGSPVMDPAEINRMLNQHVLKEFQTAQQGQQQQQQQEPAQTPQQQRQVQDPEPAVPATVLADPIAGNEPSNNALAAGDIGASTPFEDASSSLPDSPYVSRKAAPKEPSPAPPPAGDRGNRGGQAGGQAPAPGPTPAPGPASGGWDSDFEDMGITESMLKRVELAAASKHSGPSAMPAVPPPKFVGDREEVHYKVLEVHTPSDVEIILLLHNSYKDRRVYAYIRGEWMTDFHVGDSISLLVPRLDEHGGHLHALVDQDVGMIILHPDLLLSGTRIAGANDCLRQAFLDEFIGGDGGGSEPAMKGTLFHELFQEAVRPGGTRDRVRLEGRARDIVAAHTEELLAAGMDENGALAHLMASVPTILRWCKKFLIHEPHAATAIPGPSNVGEDSYFRNLAVREVLDIEESIWSTKYGVKGMIDVSAQVVLSAPWRAQTWVPPGQVQPHQLQAEGPVVTVAPIELKTGRPHPSHNAQVLLYLLLMEERYGGNAPDWALLWYSSEANPKLIKRKRSELVSLLATRNRLAAAVYLRQLPPVTQFKHKCERCFSRQVCSVSLKAIEGGEVQDFAGGGAAMGRGAPMNATLAAAFQYDAGHLTQADCEFLTKWDKLLHLEESGSAAKRPELWVMTGEERELAGRCLTGLTMKTARITPGRYIYTFAKADDSHLPALGLNEGEPLVLSVEGRHVAVGRCTLTEIHTSALVVETRRPLRKGLLFDNNPTQSAAAAAKDQGVPPCDAGIVWRLDRDEIASTYVRMRGNLHVLMRRHVDGDGKEDEASMVASKLRRLIVQQQPPAEPRPDASHLTVADWVFPPAERAAMNPDQVTAVQRVLHFEDYTLVLGMPGSGKTTAIVAMVKALVRQGKSVMLTSYTNSAVDNILLRLEADGDVPFVRLGRPGGVHPGILPYVPGQEKWPVSTATELRELGKRVQVFGATCFSANHPMLRDRIIDVCILDEAGQVTLPASLGPLMKSKSFVLVGDHNQLPPLVTNKEAEKGGLGVSLFASLAAAHPQSVVTLPVQYRMVSDIMHLPNTLFYDNKLRCGSVEQENATLALSASTLSAATKEPWVLSALQPEARVAFLATGGVPAPEHRTGEAINNPTEVAVVVRLVQVAVAAGLPPQSIGIISPYRSQVALLERNLKSLELDSVECLTVDKCQGRDKDFIIMSFVRSNEERQAGGLLTDWRRVNVAITRAKRKLVLVGDVATLTSIKLFEKMVGVCRSKGWMQELPAGAVKVNT